MAFANFDVIAPVATPRDITTRLNAELHKALAAPDLRDRLAVNGIEPVTSTPEQFTSFVRSETIRYAKVIRVANISID